MSETNIVQDNLQLRNIVTKQSDTITKLETENTSLKSAITQLRIDQAKESREKYMLAAGLGEPSRARLHDAFRNSTDNAGLKSAIHVEQRGAQ